VHGLARVALIDFDADHGNGNGNGNGSEEIFHADERLLMYAIFKD
jgi:acetoin utilization deacetylase AcuC-like enzyme